MKNEKIIKVFKGNGWISILAVLFITLAVNVAIDNQSKEEHYYVIQDTSNGKTYTCKTFTRRTSGLSIYKEDCNITVDEIRIADGYTITKKEKE